MADQAAYPYDTRLNIQFEPLDFIDIQPLVNASTHTWYNQTLGKVYEAVVPLGVLTGEYHWHKHDNDDEELVPRQGFVVPRGVVHRTRTPERTIVLMVENAGSIPTGGVATA